MNVLSGVGQYAHGKMLQSVEVTSKLPCTRFNRQVLPSACQQSVHYASEIREISVYYTEFSS